MKKTFVLLAAGLGYEFNRYIGIRGMFERSADLRTTNRCPPGDFCPEVFIENETDFNIWSFVAMPRLPLGSKASV